MGSLTAPKTQEFQRNSVGATSERQPVSGDFLRDLLDGMRCGFLSIDREGRVVMFNGLATRILELPDDPVVGQAIDDALVDHPQLVKVLRDSYSVSHLPNRAEIDLRCRSNRGKTIGFTLSLVEGDRDGEPRGAAIFFKDLTQVERKEEQERLRDRLAALGQMAANLAHEIRNPLASIEISCSLLTRRMQKGSQERELLDKIISEVRRLNGTIRSSLEFVRPLALRLAPERIEPLIDAAIKVALGPEGTEGVRVERELDPRVPACRIDRSQMRQVFENLCLNAIQSMAGSGTLRITTRRVDGPDPADVSDGAPAGAPIESAAHVEIRFSDSGPGIQPEHIDKLFYPFFTTKPNGSGVGLPVAKKIVDSHHGLLDIESRPGEGATFTVRLPLTDDPED